MKKTNRTDFTTFVSEYKKITDWKHIGRWEMPELAFSFFVKAQEQKYYDYFSIPVAPIGYLICKEDVYVPAERQETLKSFLRLKIQQGDVGFFAGILEKQKELFNLLLELSQDSAALESVFSDRSDSILRAHMLSLTAIFEFDRALSDVLEIAIANRLAKLELPAMEISEILRKDETTDTAKFSEELSNIARALHSNVIDSQATANEMAERAAQEYGYLGFYMFTGNARTKEDVLELAEREWIALNPNRNDLPEAMTQEKKAILETLDSELDWLIQLTNNFSHNRLKRVEILNKVLFCLLPTISTLAKKRQVTLSAVLSSPLDEIVGGAPLKETPLGATLTTNEEDFLISASEAVRFKEEYLDKDYSSIKTVEGQKAFAGVVQGKVRIVLGETDFPSFQDGEILVCSMTDPNFVPLMYKSAAIVTDKGGILCHAAIVAREMKKPCVIGTKIATQVFKTGDLVEVDANSGVVKVLEGTSV